MKTLWVGNFSFEDQLRSSNRPPINVLQLEAELTPCLAGAAKREDLILCPEQVDAKFRDHLFQLGIEPPAFVNIDQVKTGSMKFDMVEPWGWSPAILKMLDRFNLGTHPALEAVAAVNSREFSFKISAELSCQLPGEFEVRDVKSLENQLRKDAFDLGFVLKGNFGQSGRQQLMSREQQCGSHHHNWVVKRLKSDGAVYLEPRLDAVAEFGVQWDIPENGDAALIGIAQLKSGIRGQYYGSVVGFDHSQYPELHEIIDVQRSAVESIQQRGYFGPVGIDAMVFKDRNGIRKVRPLQDINARWTMGRLAIHWANRCFPNVSPVCWTHSSDPPCEDAVLTSPKSVGVRPTRHFTWCHPCEAANV